MLAGLAALHVMAAGALADEGGVSFWLPGQYASFAAIAPNAGFSLPMQTYYYSGSAGATKALNRGGQVSFGLDSDFAAQFPTPTWTPDATLLGARPSFSLTFFPGWSRTSANVGLGADTMSRSDEASGFGDLYPMAQLFWSKGVQYQKAMSIVVWTVFLLTGAGMAARLLYIMISHA